VAQPVAFPLLVCSLDLLGVRAPPLLARGAFDALAEVLRANIGARLAKVSACGAEEALDDGLMVDCSDDLLENPKMGRELLLNCRCSPEDHDVEASLLNRTAYNFLYNAIIHVVPPDALPQVALDRIGRGSSCGFFGFK